MPNFPKLNQFLTPQSNNQSNLQDSTQIRQSLPSYNLTDKEIEGINSQLEQIYGRTPTESEFNEFLKYSIQTVPQSLEALDFLSGGKAARSGATALLENKGLSGAANAVEQSIPSFSKEGQFSSGRAPDPKELGHAFLKKLEDLGMPLKAPGSPDEYALETPVGMAADIAINPANLIGIGSSKFSRLATKIPKLSQDIKYTEPMLKSAISEKELEEAIKNANRVYDSRTIPLSEAPTKIEEPSYRESTGKLSTIDDKTKAAPFYEFWKAEELKKEKARQDVKDLIEKFSAEGNPTAIFDPEKRALESTKILNNENIVPFERTRRLMEKKGDLTEEHIPINIEELIKKRKK